MPEQIFRMFARVSLMSALCCLLLMPELLQATSLVKVKASQGNTAAEAVTIDSARAHNFLSQTRPKRNVEPKWYHGNPDFQSYYRFYNSIGHIEGLYEIDRIRILYQQMRHLEQAYGKDASIYQSMLGVQTTAAPPATAPPPTTTKPPPPPTTLAPTPDPLADATVIYLCNPKDSLCKPQIVFLPTGGVPVLCDPRYNPACQPKEVGTKAVAPPPPPPAPKKAAPPPPPPPPPPAPVVTVKAMEYDCDPYWDPDCLIDHPPRLIAVAPEPVEEKAAEEPAPTEKAAPAAEVEKKSLYPYFDPYDFKRDLYDPFRYADQAPADEGNHDEIM